MPTNRSDLRAGLFILASLALGLGVVVAIKGVRTVFAHEATRRARFSLADDLGGLRVGDDVRVGGFKVGAVRGIDLVGSGSAASDSGAAGDGGPTVASGAVPTGGAAEPTAGPTAGPYLVVRFTFPDAYPLAADARLNVQSSLTGTTVLNIDSLGSGPPLSADQELAGHTAGFSGLLAEAGALGPDVRGLLQQLRTTTLPRVDAAAGRADAALASVRTAADRTADAAASLGGLLGDAKPDARRTIANLAAITTDARVRLPALLDHADATLVKAAATVDDARAAMADARATAANARQLTAAARDVVVGNRGKLDATIASLKQTGDDLREATAEVRRNPWRLLYHPGPGEMDNLALYDAARQFADGATHVDDAALALRDALQNPAVDRRQVRQLTADLDDAFAHFNGVEQKLWKSVRQ